MSAYSDPEQRLAELRAFDATKAGVKGLADAGFASIPRFFVLPDHLDLTPGANLKAPVVDLDGVASGDPARRAAAAAEVGRAAEALGIFHVANHGVPQQVLDEMLERVRMFHEEEAEVKGKYYTRDLNRKVVYNSNFDLYQAPTANWRDTLFCSVGPEPPQPEELPIACRDITFEYTSYMQKLGTVVLELLSEALGLSRNHLIEMECAKGHSVLMHYYPACPEPHLTLGTSKHSDSDFLTVLLQDSLGGLQILHQNRWLDVPPVPGALLINIGDLLQLISNDKFKSVEHRVLANSSGPRISVAFFFSTHLSTSTRLYGPLKELTSHENPPRYKEITTKDFVEHYNRKGLDGRSALDHFRL